MMVGGYLWGSLSDLIGRRSCLITSLTFNGVFGLASAFSPSYPVFLLFRFLSGVGSAQITYRICKLLSPEFSPNEMLISTNKVFPSKSVTLKYLFLLISFSLSLCQSWRLISCRVLVLFRVFLEKVSRAVCHCPGCILDPGLSVCRPPRMDCDWSVL